ncbi:ABC transporter ATP-binding protein [Candidatus Aerophobetes bacterium]|nr:ABC transporter ATP-binding protein [Candidatus Aerophobetes bacterium]
MSKVELKDVWKIYPRGNVVAVRELTFTCNNGEFLAILGPSGSGKSSTLRMLAGLEEVTRGEILFDGKVVNNLDPAHRNIALAFESYALYHRLNVYENIAFPLRARGMKGKEVDKKVKFIAELLDLVPYLKKYPSSLAGGIQQRVSLARALVREPNLTLLDEPISHMDQRVRHEIRARIRHLHDELGLTTIYVTHDQAEAISLCDRLIVLHQGRLQQIGKVEEIWNCPANRFVAYFVGEPAMNFIQGEVESSDRVIIPTVDGKRVFKVEGEVDAKYVGKEITVGVRPQQIKVCRESKGENVIPGEVRIIEFQGDKTILTLTLSDKARSDVKVVVPAQEVHREGETIWLYFPPPVIHLFDGEIPVIKREIKRN